MEILKTIREQYGFTQQDMATLLGMTREHYSMVETDKRMLPPAPAQRFAALLPTFLHSAPLPPLPEQLPETLHEETHRLLLKAQRDLYKAEQDLQACIMALSRQQQRAWLLSQTDSLTALPLTTRAKKLLNSLAATPQATAQAELQGQWLLCHTRRQLCQTAVDAYTRLLENRPV